MATILQPELLQFFSPIIVFIFILVIFWAILSKINLFGNNPWVNGLIAFCITILFIIIPSARQIIELVMPWFIIFVLMGLLIIICFMFLGVKEDVITSVAKTHPAILSVIIGFIVISFLIAFTKIFGMSILQYPSSAEIGFGAMLKRIVLNPKMIGVIIILIIAAETIRTVGYKK